MRSVRIIGMGRVGSALAGSLDSAGWRVDTGGREQDLSVASLGVDLVLIATPDAAIGGVAAAMAPGQAVVGHLSGAIGLAALAPHAQRTAIHPLVSIPAGPLGRQRLTGGAHFAVAGHPIGRELVEALGGTAFEVPDGDRVLYHASACIASNHLVALLGQVERVAARVGLPLDLFMDLVRGTVDSVAEVGPAGALTGPAARGDEDTIAGHLAALDPDERDAYEALAEQARRLVRPAERRGP